MAAFLSDRREDVTPRLGTRPLRLAEQLRTHGSWSGETHVQKATYLLQEIGHVPLGFNFVLYHHGPFSFDLRDELTAVRGAGFLRLRPNSPPYGPTIEITESGDRLIERSGPSLKQAEPAIDFIAEKLGSSNVLRLEKLATAVMVARNAPAESVDWRARRLTAIKPHIPLESSRAAVEEVESLMIQAREAVPSD